MHTLTTPPSTGGGASNSSVTLENASVDEDAAVPVVEVEDELNIVKEAENAVEDVVEEDPFAELEEDEVVKEDDENLAEANLEYGIYYSVNGGGTWTLVDGPVNAALRIIKERNPEGSATQNLIKLTEDLRWAEQVNITDMSVTIMGAKNNVLGQPVLLRRNGNFLLNVDANDSNSMPAMKVTNVVKDGRSVVFKDLVLDGTYAWLNEGQEAPDVTGNIIRAWYSATDHTGSIEFNNVTFRNCTSIAGLEIQGAALSVWNGQLTMKGCNVLNNTITPTTGNEVNAKGAIAHIATGGRKVLYTTIENCTVSNNKGAQGGGLYVSSGPLTITGGTFSGNEATISGGGVCAVTTTEGVYADTTITGVTFTNNKGGTGSAATGAYSTGGGGLYLWNMITSVVDCTFTGNTADVGGGARVVNSPSVVFQNSNFKNNKANLVTASLSSESGGAICFDRSGGGEKLSYAFVNGGTFENNQADYVGGGIYTDSETSLKVVNVEFKNNKVNHTTIDGSVREGTGGAIGANGALDVDRCTFTANQAEGTAGAIRAHSDFNSGTNPELAYRDTFVLNNSTFTDNTSVVGGAIYSSNKTNVSFENLTFTNNSASRGGAALIKGGTTESTISIVNSHFNQNKAVDKGVDNEGGGALWFNDSTLTANISGGCTFTGNTSKLGGGAVVVGNGANATISDTTFTNNKANGGHGGAVYASTNSDLKVTGSIFRGNESSGSGGAIIVTNWSNNPANLVLTKSELTGNTAGSLGGGFYSGGNATLSDVTITGNTASSGGGGYISQTSVNIEGGTVIVNNNTPNNLFFVGTTNASGIVMNKAVNASSRIGITRAGTAKEQAGQGFGIAGTGAAMAKAAESFFADNNATLVGSLSGSALIWKLNNAEVIGINVGNFANARSTSVSPNAVVAGEQVTVTVTPNNGYVLNPASVVVKDGNGNNVSGVTVNGNTITFTAPVNGPATVTGECTLVPNPSGKLQNRTNGAIDAALNGSTGEIVVLTKNNRQVARVFAVSGSTYTRMNINWTHSGNRHTGTIPNFNPNGTYVIALKGDINFDGRVVASDAQQTARQAVTGLRTPFNDLQRKIADTAGTGETVDISDAQQIARWAVGLSANGFTW